LGSGACGAKTHPEKQRFREVREQGKLIEILERRSKVEGNSNSSDKKKNKRRKEEKREKGNVPDKNRWNTKREE